MRHPTINNTIRSFCLLLCLPLSACATVQHGPNTSFIVETSPPGARVITDKKLRRTSTKAHKPVYYGCESTPCSIKLPRRSDFNVMIVKEGYRPSTHVIIKERSRLISKKAKRGNTATGVAAGTVVTGMAVASADSIAATVAAPTVLSSTVGVAVAASTAIIFSIPVAGAATGIDLASGAMTDITPNPLNVSLEPEVSPEDTQYLIEAFLKTRHIHADLQKDQP